MLSRDFLSLTKPMQSTVILTVNVGFLAIPGVGVNSTSPSQTAIFTSSTQIASCLSIQASIGSIVIGLLLVRHSVTKKDEDTAGAVSRKVIPLTCAPT